MDADAQKSIPFVSQAQPQLTAPPGWTKKLVPAKAKFATLRKHDVVFVAPDGQEIPSQWHLRRYLKAHPESPPFADFDWNSGEESVRRSARVSTREPNVTQTPLTKRKAKRAASEMDAEGEEEVKAKTSSLKRQKKADKSADTTIGAITAEDEAVLPDKDETMHEAGETPVSGKPDEQDSAPVTDAIKEGVHTGNISINDGQKEGSDADKVSIMPVIDGQKEGSDAEKFPTILDADGQKGADAEKAFDGAKEAQVEADKKPATSVTSVLMEEPKVVEEEQGIEEQEHVQEVETLDNELLPNSKTQGVSGLISDELKGEGEVIESQKPLESAGETVVESKEPNDTKEDHKVMLDTHVLEERQEAEKKSLEPLMQKEEQERLLSVHNSSPKVEHMKERSPNELSNSPVPLSVGNQ